jgi:hypothetical protein
MLAMGAELTSGAPALDVPYPPMAVIGQGRLYNRPRCHRHLILRAWRLSQQGENAQHHHYGKGDGVKAVDRGEHVRLHPHRLSE